MVRPVRSTTKITIVTSASLALLYAQAGCLAGDGSAKINEAAGVSGEFVGQDAHVFDNWLQALA